MPYSVKIRIKTITIPPPNRGAAAMKPPHRMCVKTPFLRESPLPQLFVTGVILSIRAYDTPSDL